jgi:subfamily B ATP-binding cassette protein MsbA
LPVSRSRSPSCTAGYKDGTIILFDKATASLDSESERTVQEAIGELCRGRTTFVVAHRLSHADRTLVVENALIVESGRHEELLHRGGRYASSYRLQLMEQATERQPIAIGGQPALRLPPAFPIYLKRRFAELWNVAS